MKYAGEIIVSVKMIINVPNTAKFLQSKMCASSWYSFFLVNYFHFNDPSKYIFIDVIVNNEFFRGLSLCEFVFSVLTTIYYNFN
jgi:hypothetical protein